MDPREGDGQERRGGRREGDAVNEQKTSGPTTRGLWRSEEENLLRTLRASTCAQNRTPTALHLSMRPVLFSSLKLVPTRHCGYLAACVGDLGFASSADNPYRSCSHFDNGIDQLFGASILAIVHRLLSWLSTPLESGTAAR